MTKLNKILIGLVVVIIVAAGAIIYWQKSGSGYAAVYLSTGDVYFGKLSRFPKMALTNVWFLAKSENGFSVNQLTKAVWGPEDKIVFNRDNVVWVAALDKESQLLEALENPESINQGAVPSGASGVNPNTPPNSFAPSAPLEVGTSSER